MLGSLLRKPWRHEKGSKMKESGEMKALLSNRSNWLKIRGCAGATILTMLLAILAACATKAPVQPPPTPPERAESKSMVPLVAPLQDGREGFIITETARMDDASRRDFENAVTLLKEAAYAQAIELLKKVVARSPGVTAPYIDLGMAYAQIDKPEQAEVQFKAALQLVPGHPVASNQYGLLLRKAGRFDEARKTYEASLARFADYSPLHRNLGILCDLYLNDLQCALAQYEAYSRGVPEDEKVKLWIADVNGRLGKK